MPGRSETLWPPAGSGFPLAAKDAHPRRHGDRPRQRPAPKARPPSSARPSARSCSSSTPPATTRSPTSRAVLSQPRHHLPRTRSHQQQDQPKQFRCRGRPVSDLHLRRRRRCRTEASALRMGSTKASALDGCGSRAVQSERLTGITCGPTAMQRRACYRRRPPRRFRFRSRRRSHNHRSVSNSMRRLIIPLLLVVFPKVPTLGSTSETVRRAGGRAVGGCWARQN
jgi:hypothetical protein